MAVTRFDLDSQAQLVAHALGLPRPATVETITGHCRGKVERWLEEQPRCQSIEQVQKLVCHEIGLVFEEIRTDADKGRLIQKYKQLREPACFVLQQLDHAADLAMIVRLQPPNQTALGRYVAFIDCRGKKGERRFFSKWHEIAHLLTDLRVSDLRGYRLGAHERLMDRVAAEIGFYDPLFRPILERRVKADMCLTFAGVERIRSDFSHEASYQATLLESVSRCTFPCIYLEAAARPKQSEEEPVGSSGRRQFAVEPRPLPLRVVDISANAPARAGGLRLHPDMEVPPDSIIADLWCEPAVAARRGPQMRLERLASWVGSDGKALSDLKVCVVARRQMNSVQALISSVNASAGQAGSLDPADHQAAAAEAGRRTARPSPWPET